MDVTRYTVARYAVDVAQGRRPLPSITDTLPLAETFRRELFCQCRQVLALPRGEPGKQELVERCPALVGKDAGGRPLRGHGHAYFLAVDEDGDDRIDHMTVVAEQGFADDEVRALDRLRHIQFGEGEPLRLLLVGLGDK